MADQRLLISYFASSGPLLMDLAAYSDLTVLVGDDLSFAETALPGVYACTRSGVTNSGAHVGQTAEGMTWHFNLANATGDYWGQQLPITATVATPTGAITLPAIPNDWITAAGIATDAIGSAEVSAAAVTKIQAGLSTYAGGAVSSVTGNVGGNVTGSVGSVASFGTLVADIATAVWGATVRTLSAFGFTPTPSNASDTTAIKAKTDNLPGDPADASVIAGRFDTLDTSVADLPTNAELATALGTADDAVLTAIAALNNLSPAQVATALANYDGPTNAEMEARTLIAASYATVANQTTINNNVVAIPAAITTDHGSGSYVRNTEPTTPPTAAAIVTALWTDLLASSDFSTAASIGKLLKDNIDAAVSSRMATFTYTAPDNTGIGNAATSAATAASQAGAANSGIASVNTLVQDLPTNTELTAAFASFLTTAMVESYAADGAPPTPAQCLMLIQQSLHEFSISNVTRTVKKLDGTTTAAAFTLDSATAPTSTTRSA